MNNIANQTPFLRAQRHFPTTSDLLALEVNRTYVDIANAVNRRTISIYPTNKAANTGESWFFDRNNKQQTLRQIYSFGAIAPGTELDIPTQITTFDQFTRIYGTVVTNVVDWRPLPFVDPTLLTNGMALLVGPIGAPSVQNIRIIVGATAPAVTEGLIVLEWLSDI
jgi:hypothetical protein